MRVDLAFGKNGLSLELPGQFDYRILEARGARSLTDPARALDDALARPIGSPSLGELARGRRSAAISVCDITRPAPNRQTLPPILRTLAEAGITAPNITILVATGLHRAATAEEIDLIVGPEIARQYIVLNHDARNLDEHRYLGKTRNGHARLYRPAIHRRRPAHHAGLHRAAPDARIFGRAKTDRLPDWRRRKRSR